jgi:hypothetical protein
MSLTAAVGLERPFLRRYARAYGVTTIGDAAVREVLEAMLVAPDEFVETKAARISPNGIPNAMVDCKRNPKA